MTTKIEVIDQLRQLQVVMQRTSARSAQTCSSYRGQGLVLRLLKEQPELSRRELETRLDISRQALTELLQKMERSGHIIRRHDPRDRRVVLIRLTQEGRAAAEGTNAGASDLSRILECLDEDKLFVFSQCLDDILSYHKELYPNFCVKCTGPENCSHDYLKYGHDRPNPKFCKYAHLFSASADSETEANFKGGDLA